MLFKSPADGCEAMGAAISTELIGSQHCGARALRLKPKKGRKNESKGEKRKKIPSDWKEFSVPVNNKRIQQIALALRSR